ncbi:MAG: helix-turn-helix domain-containing protein [Nitrososphaerota archaeon]|nr:helix-turn-helix domain-containing protein [Nitrososphaerota archaeon]MDG6921862.1 helix-turn-helix domain-containing protein [Nitrososphaerota archaeon]
MDDEMGTDNENLDRKLDIIAAILLARSGMTKKDVAQILGCSEKTIQRMFKEKFNKIGVANV